MKENMKFDTWNADEHDPYTEGKEARDNGQSDSANPYPSGSLAFLTRNDGYSSRDNLGSSVD